MSTKTEKINTFQSTNEMKNNQDGDMEHYNRNMQDSMFVDLFSTEENLLDLYRSLHPEDTSVQLSDIKNVTLTNVFVNGLRNDVGLLVGDRLIILTEHQSTVNKNMPVRALLYYAEQLKRYLFSDNSRRKKVFQKSLMKLPYPEFYVIFTGNDSEFSDSALQLSDAFAVKDFINVTVKVISQKNLAAHGLLSEYLEFIKILKDNINCKGDRKEAIKETVQTCLASGILINYLNMRKEGIADMLMKEMTIEELIGTAEENRMEGRMEGMQEGIRGVIKLCKQYNIPFFDAVKQIAESYSLSENEAELRVKKYW